LKLHSPEFFISKKAGVNAQVAYLSIAFDMLAFLRSPIKTFDYIMLCIHCRFFFLLLVFLIVYFIILLISPFLILQPAFFGRLSIVKELRGKARVIGITNQWTQWLLKPLHNAIQSKLDTIPEDGTRDQLAPIHKMTSIHGISNQYYSLDLSNATDRLPVELQKDILCALNFDGNR
jgi:hypothetical protein